MDFFRIECFLKAAEVGNMTKAAERMNITQPAMSFQIRELEREVQLTLFQRDRNGICLTEAGRLLRSGFLHIMDSYRHLLEEARACAYGKARLTIGYHGSVDWAGVTRFVADFSRRHPEIELVILQQQWRELADYLEQGILNVAFLETSELIHRPLLASEALFQEKTCFALSPSHPLARRESVTVEDLAGETILMNNHASDSMTEIVDHLYRSGLKREDFRFFDQPDITLAMAAAGQGLASIPWSFRIENSALRYVEYDAACCRMHYSLAWRADADNQTLRIFREEAAGASWPYPNA